MIRFTFGKVAGRISSLFKDFVHKHRRNKLISTCFYIVFRKMEYAELERFIKQIYGIIKHSMPTEAAEMMTQLEKLKAERKGSPKWITAKEGLKKVIRSICIKSANWANEDGQGDAEETIRTADLNRLTGLKLDVLNALGGL